MNKDKTQRELADWGDTLTTCQAIHNDDQPVVIKLIFRKSDRKKHPHVQFEYGTIADHAAHFPRWRKEGAEAFLTLAITDGQGQSNENMLSTWALAIDLDKDDNIAAFECSPFKPTLAIQTSEGRHHLVWVMTHPLTRDDAHPLLIALATRFNADPVFANAAQTIRLPGFVNGKHGTEVTLLAWSDKSRTYRIEDLKHAFDIEFALGKLCTSHHSLVWSEKITPAPPNAQSR